MVEQDHRRRKTVDQSDSSASSTHGGASLRGTRPKIIKGKFQVQGEVRHRSGRDVA
jgi:hypothetical protein